MIIDDIKFKELLKSCGLKKSSLCEMAGISSKTISKIGKGEEVSNFVVNKICNYLNCDVKEIVCVNNVLKVLKQEMESKQPCGLYHETQVRLTYNSNHIEGSNLTEDQTRFIFETKTLSGDVTNIKVDDIIETTNHFKCIDYIIKNAKLQLSEKIIKDIHFLLKNGTSDECSFGAGVYKIFQNTVGGIETTKTINVQKEIKELLKEYNSKKKIVFEDIVEFHYKFEKIHPFQDGNGRVGRLIAFKECLKNNIVPFYIDDKFKFEYYNGLKNWESEPSYLVETCLFGQDLYKKLLTFFEVEF